MLVVFVVVKEEVARSVNGFVQLSAGGCLSRARLFGTCRAALDLSFFASSPAFFTLTSVSMHITP